MWQRAVYHLILASLLLVNPVESNTIRVPADQPTIQAGIDAATESDTVLVSAGIYAGQGNRNITFGGKNLILRSEVGPDATIINLSGVSEARGFIFSDGEDAASVIDGFTVTGATGFYIEGVAVRVSNSSPSFRNCIFESNLGLDFWSVNCYTDPFTEERTCFCDWESSVMGGAVACVDASPSFTNCRFSDNWAAVGGGIYVGGTSSVCIRNSVINANGAIDDFPANCDFFGALPGAVYGGGLACATDASVLLDHCTIVRNTTTNCGGSAIFGDNVTLINCIVAYNGACDFAGPIVAPNGNVSLSYCDVFENSGWDWVGDIADQAGINGNISAAPLFCDPESGDYHLNASSPCLPSLGSGRGEWMGALSVGCGDYVCGDVNWDGELTEADLQQMKELYFSQPSDWFLPVASSDLDCNGVITIADLARLAGYIYGYGPAPCCVPPPKERPPDSMSAVLK